MLAPLSYCVAFAGSPLEAEKARRDPEGTRPATLALATLIDTPWQELQPKGFDARDFGIRAWGSEVSVRAAEHASDLARRYVASVTLLFVADSDGIASSPLPEDVKTQLQSAMREAYEEMLGKGGSRL